MFFPPNLYDLSQDQQNSETVVLDFFLLIAGLSRLSV